MEILIQYAVIALVFLVAMVFLIKRFMPSKSKQLGCNKGCGCAMTDVENSKK